MNKYRSLILPIVVISLYIAFLVAVRGSLPSPKDLVVRLASFYGHYGYEIVFLGSMLEALVVINFFAPGAVAMGLGAVFARTGQLNLTLAILAAVSGAIIGYILDFALGFYGFFDLLEGTGLGNVLSKVETQLNKSAIKSFVLGFIHPDIGALVALAAGIIRMNFIRFVTLAFIATLAWYSLWGILVFLLGEILLTVLTKYVFVLILLTLSVWVLATIYETNQKTP